MRNLRVAVAAAIAASTSVVVFSTAGAVSGPNETSYWEGRTEHPAQCYKHDPPSQQNAHGSLTADGKAVVLNEFNPNWGDHWELLVVKAGSTGGDGNGNAVYPHPSSGVAYAPPLNDGGQAPTVSHWIVCKGTSTATVETSVTWRGSNGTCADPDGRLRVEFDADAVTYDGDPAGTYANGTTVTGAFTAKPGFAIYGNAGPFQHTFSLYDGPCDDEVVPAAPTFIDPTCASPTAQIVGADDTDSVGYEVTGTVAPGETVTVAAIAMPGYVLDPDAPAEWEHTFGVLDDDCVIDANPVATLESDCASAVFTFSNDVGDIPDGYTAETADFTYTVDGQQEVVQVAPNGPTVEIPIEFDEDTGTHTVQLGDEPAVEIETNCELDEVTTVAPTFIDPTCDDESADLDLPIVAGVFYETEGSVAPGATVTVTATAADGYVLVGDTEWTHEYPSIDDLSCEEPAIEVSAFSQVCRSDVPFVVYDIKVTGTDADTAKLTFRAADGDVAAVHEGVPLKGEVVYPGASVDPQDWPGWKLNEAGFWVLDPADADWRDGLTVEVEVNPTATAAVTYPAASEACLSPEIEPPTSSTTPTTVNTIPATTVDIGQAGPTVPAAQLPKTGSDTTSGIVTLGSLFLLAGAVLMGVTRRRATNLR